MKTTLKVLSLFTAACIPSAFAAGLAGLNLPWGLDPLTAFSAFVASAVASLAASDYARPHGRLVVPAHSTRPVVKAAHPLAA